MSIQDIQTASLLLPVRAIFSVIQHIMLFRSGNMDVMSEIDQMVIFYLTTRKKINFLRLKLDFILDAVGAERRKHTTLLYDMFLTRVFIKAQLPLDGQKPDKKRPTTIMKTFSALGLKPQIHEKEKEEENKKKAKSKPSKESTKKNIRR